MSRNLFIITKKISAMTFRGLNTDLYIKPYFALLTKMLRHNGTVYTVKALKTMRLHCTRYLCGAPLLVNKEGVGVDKSGWPKALHFLKPLLDEGLIGKKFLLTLLTLTRTLDLRDGEQVKPNYSTITDLGPPKEYIIPRGVIRQFVKYHNLNTKRPEFNAEDIWLSVKGSPTGKATLSAVVSLFNLSYAQMQWIYDLTCIKGITWFDQFYTLAFNKELWKVSWLRKKTATHESGQLSFIKDPECKLRIIAMLDYTSQLFLRPIHNILLKHLRKIPMDRTYTQDPKGPWERNDHSFWSLDLSAATDRFPVKLQMRVIEEIFNDSRFADSWRKLLTERNFASPDGPKRYAVGQPMGAYSSWAAFTLTHHLVVWYAAQLAGLNPRQFDQYIILGDDIVIKHDEVAKKYHYVMSKLGVELSPAKSHISKDTYEFAKRWLQDGKEITGLPMRGLVKEITNPFIVYVILFDWFKIKGNTYTWGGDLVSFCKYLYKGLKLWNGKKYIFQSLRFVPRLERFALGLNLSFGFGSYDQWRNAIAIATVPNDSYVVPGPRESASEMRRILGLGLREVVSSGIRSSLTIYDTLVEKLPDLGLEDRNDLGKLPIFSGVLNHIRKLMKATEAWDTGNVPLADVADELTVLDIDSVFAKERHKSRSLAKVGEIAMKGLAALCKQDDIMYGSSRTESTYTSGSDIHKSVEDTLAVVLKDLETIEKGEWKAKVSAADAWANFKW